MNRLTSRLGMTPSTRLTPMKVARFWAGGLLLLALPLGAAEALTDTNALRTMTFDNLIFEAQRYSSTDDKKAVKAQARDEVFRRGPDSLRWLLNHAYIDNIMVQVLTEEMVGRLKAEQAVPVLLEALDAANPRVRRTSAYYLSLFTTPEHADRLIPLLKDEEVCGAAIRTLGKWKTARAVPLIAPFLKHAKETRRIAAANALRDIGDPAAVPLLMEALGDPLFTVRETAARGLTTLGPQAERAMIQALPSADDQTLRLLIRALGAMPSHEAARKLKPFLQHPDPAVRADAQRAIEAIAAPRPAA